MQKSVKICVILSIICVLYVFYGLFCLNQQSVYAKQIDDAFEDRISFNSSAKSAIMIEASTGRVLYSKNSNQQLPMASTTKIVTAITVLDNCDNLDEKITIPKECVGIEGTSIYLKAGEQFSVRELLYGLMLRSGNDAAITLAEYVGSGVDNFCALMNKTAEKLGLSNSHFANPHGLDIEGHFTTAHDLAAITAYALNNKEFLKIVSTKSITIGEGESARLLINKNKLLKSFDGCIGVKTGFTSKAGRCLVSAAEKDGMRLVCVVLNCGPMFEESAKMLELGFENFSMTEVVPSYNTYGDVAVENGMVNYVSTYTRNGFCYPMSVNERAKLNIVVDIPQSIKAPVKKDMDVGTIQVYIGKHLIFSEKIYTMDKVASRQIKDKVKDIIDNWNA